MAEIMSIRIKYGDKEIDLTLDEAKSLLQCLKEALGDKYVYVPSAPSYPPINPWSPVIYKTPEVTCSAKE